MKPITIQLETIASQSSIPPYSPPASEIIASLAYFGMLGILLVFGLAM